MGSENFGHASYTPEQFAPLFAAEDRHFWFRARNRCIAAALRSLPDFHAIHDILEVGCGTGVVLAELQRLFPRGRIVGLDLFEEGLMFARRRFSGTLLQADVRRHVFDRPFDLIGAFDVIEHLDEDETLLRRLWHQLRPGGHLIVTVPAHQALWSYFDNVAHHRRRYAPAELERKLTATGFCEPYETQFMAALFPVMWLKRRWLGKNAKLAHATTERQQAAVESELQVNPIANWLLEVMTRPDAYLVAHRLPVPFGTSLLAIATRPKDGSGRPAHA
jgi:SAM-dependent methyltransferase